MKQGSHRDMSYNTSTEDSLTTLRYQNNSLPTSKKAIFLPHVHVFEHNFIISLPSERCMKFLYAALLYAGK